MTYSELIRRHPFISMQAVAYAGLCLFYFGIASAEAEAYGDRVRDMALQDSIAHYREEARLARLALYELANGELFLESHSKRGREYFRYYRINALGKEIGYAIESNMPMDLDHLHKLDQWNYYMDTAKIPSRFWVPTLFRESSVGLNVNHKRNRDGSIDGGFSGINSIWGLPKSLQDEMDKFRMLWRLKGLDSLAYQEQEAVWMLGKTRARKAGVIR